MIQLSPFPPSFDGSAWAYHFALFSLLLVSALSAARLAALWFERAKLAQLQPLLPGLVLETRPRPRWPLARVYRWILGAMYLTVLMGAAPDVAVMLCWGEVSPATMAMLTMVDRLFDGFTLLPFLTASVMDAATSQTLPQRLTMEAQHQVRTPPWERLRQPLMIVLFVAIISAGVTVGKAGT
jgi:hypothetical protein